MPLRSQSPCTYCANKLTDADELSVGGHGGAAPLPARVAYLPADVADGRGGQPPPRQRSLPRPQMGGQVAREAVPARRESVVRRRNWKTEGSGD